MSTDLILTETETSALSACETIIEKNLTCFVDCGNALLKIRDQRLYRADFPDFQSYCRERWQIGRSHAYRLIEAAEIAKTVPEVETERQARELAKYDKDLQKAVFTITKAMAGDQPITSGLIRTTADTVAALIETGGMDDGSGEMKPLGVLLKANVTEAVFERMKRQEVHINGKREKKIREATSPKDVPTLPTGTVLIGLVRDLIRGIDAMNCDRGVKLHPVLYGAYHFGKAVIGEPTGEMTLLIDDVTMTGCCDGCPDEDVGIRETALTIEMNGLRSVRLKLCEHCVLRYQRIVEIAPEGEIVAR